MLAAASLGGCLGARDENDPPKPPTAAKLSRIAAATQQPAYWLGPSFQGLDISAATATRKRVGFTYGPWTCDSGCNPSGGVFTSRRNVLLTREDFSDRANTRNCWTRIAQAVAVLIGCRPDLYEQELVIFLGDREISISSLYTADGQGDIPVRAIVPRLRPLNANAPWPLPRPKRLTCRQLKRIDERYQRHMPQTLRPRLAC
jgi:hypothetical protein